MKPGVPLIIGNSLAIWKVKTYIYKVAATDSHVLITGETGSGKELAARCIHQHSVRFNKPFVAINCAALPDGLLESELFGYERGAFTGAFTPYPGKLKLADGGTVLFDEIGDMSPYAQAKILRVIDTKEVYPLGARRSVPLDTRFIAATNRDLEQQVVHGSFRRDLFYRLNVAQINLPPLRDRKEDIPALVDYYIQRYSRHTRNEFKGFSIEAMEVLQNYRWPGNIRELMNLIERVFIDPPARQIDIADLPMTMSSVTGAKEEKPAEEREMLLYTLSKTNWNKTKAAERLRWSRMTVYRKIAKYHLVRLDPDAFSDSSTPEAVCNSPAGNETEL